MHPCTHGDLGTCIRPSIRVYIHTVHSCMRACMHTCLYIYTRLEHESKQKFVLGNPSKFSDIIICCVAADWDLSCPFSIRMTPAKSGSKIRKFLEFFRRASASRAGCARRKFSFQSTSIARLRSSRRLCCSSAFLIIWAG